MNTALATARALDVDSLIVVECLTEVDAVMVRKLNEQMTAKRG